MTTKASPKARGNERYKQNERKWTAALMQAGWTVLPSVILERQKALGLDAVDLNILLQLARYWWMSDRPPFPSKNAIAECIGVSTSTVQRHIARMERDGMIRREYRYKPNSGGQDTNAYLFGGLIKAATPFAQEASGTRAKRKEEDAERLRRKKPKPTIVGKTTKSKARQK